MKIVFRFYRIHRREFMFAIVGRGLAPAVFLINKSRPCHPERSVAKSNCEAAPSKARWDLGRNTLKFYYRSRFAPSLRSGSTTKISHREIFSAQDDTAGWKNIKFVCFYDRRGRRSLQVCAYITIASLLREVALRSNDGRSF